MKPHFLPTGKLDEWLARLAADAEVFLPDVVQDQVHWRRFHLLDAKEKTDGPVLGLDRIRAAEPIKSFFFSPRERVASFPDHLEPGEPESRILFGAKACDMLPLKVHERMFLTGEFKDPFYEARLRKTLVVVADCPKPESSCFCNLVGRSPYSTEDGDVALSIVEGGYVLEPLTDEGEGLLRRGGDAVQPATEVHIGARAEARKAAVALLEHTNPKPWRDDLPKAIWERSLDGDFWQEQAGDCVECFGCLMACPTCYCYLLYDRASEAGLERTKVWDACYLAAYQRVGGGANPRGEFLKRFANRFQCKFTHFKNAHGFYACSGCGRCFRVCMGKIDIREVLAAV